MRPVFLVFSAAVAATVLAVGAPAHAQTREAPTLRRLDWAGRPETSGPAGLRRPAPVIPHAGVAPTEIALRPARAWRPTPGSVDGRPGLTPADAFFVPGETAAAPARPTETFAAPPPVRSEPAPQRRPQPQPQPQPERRPAPVEAMPLPAAAPPASARLVQPSPVAARPAPVAPSPQPQPMAAEVAPVETDPMAPRRDAPIFRIQGARQPQGEPQALRQAQPDAASAPEAVPAQGQPQGQPQPYGQGARYYSVHRQAGRQPDPTPIPEQVWLDRMPVELDRTPESEDLAVPPETPQMVRDAEGRVRPMRTPATDGDLP